MANKSKERGNKAENIAFEFLTSQGLTLVDRNFHSRDGEIDLIMFDQAQLTFIEVRYRQNNDFINAVETIDSQKRQRIIATAQYFLFKNEQYADYDIRFDAIIIQGSIFRPEIEWIKNAFQA